MMGGDERLEAFGCVNGGRVGGLGVKEYREIRGSGEEEWDKTPHSWVLGL